MSRTNTRESRVTVDNWQEPGNLQWSFLHMDELFANAAIRATAADSAGPLERATPGDPLGLHSLPVRLPGGSYSTVEQVLATTSTDAWMLLHGNEVLAEEYFGAMSPGTRHLLMSVSKSIVSAVVGVLAGQGKIDTAQAIEHYVPGLRASGYRGATVRDILDMRSGIKFSEEYLDAGSEVRKLDEAVGWAPRNGGAGTLKEFLVTLEQVREHGGHFEYRSCETDVLGWLCEAASGKPFAELASELLWARMGGCHDAYICLDAAGTGMFDGGICATLGDMALFGAMIRDGGVTLNDERILEPGWVEDIFAGGPDTAAAFAAGNHAEAMPGGRYRSQFWFLSDDPDTAYCLGIHGQMVYINRKSGVVGVKFSSTALPVDPVAGPAAAAMFEAISERLVALNED
ncbi:serine hydrolase domain-containing protein [Arthrobacter sp. FW306-2-2C-D06B]|uniref:serine hydrolase domain-containing protein n=1 Tax=Arthrobacter sp. FW306-2-2C-D06B TaxID=2879618 RepID=UPI001F403DB9|nr:serine hydrolase [Arthrobacter sp. FW306-2-2C-D06B]UKA58678.1 beta-lactamase family protein [Arthrobacter sp. FW306-2-2C-D06B]